MAAAKRSVRGASGTGEITHEPKPPASCRRRPWDHAALHSGCGRRTPPFFLRASPVFASLHHHVGGPILQGVWPLAQLGSLEKLARFGIVDHRCPRASACSTEFVVGALAPIILGVHGTISASLPWENISLEIQAAWLPGNKLGVRYFSVGGAA